MLVHCRLEIIEISKIVSERIVFKIVVSSCVVILQSEVITVVYQIQSVVIGTGWRVHEGVVVDARRTSWLHEAVATTDLSW